MLLVFFSNIFSKDFDENFNKANNYYNNSKYLESIQIYESILVQGSESSNLYYNLGNAYFRQNQIGQSVWAYKKALRMDPRNKDLINNLSIVNARIKDRVILPDEFYFVKIYGKLKSRFILKEWLYIGGVIVLLTAVFFLVSPDPKLRVIFLSICKSALKFQGLREPNGSPSKIGAGELIRAAPVILC